MATGSKFTFADLQNPLFLHPSDGPTSISVSKLQGASDYRSWRRSMEIQLMSKRKLGFVDGSVVKSTTDATDATQWETCNNMVISWLHNNISDSVKRSILFINLASEVWKQLERRFMLTNGSRKYKLSKDLFSLRQNDLSVADYYTAMSTLWEEIDSMTVLPRVTVDSIEVTALLSAIESMREESRLFLFLNGLNEVYGAQRSQLLMLSPLPTVEVACAALQQEESQRDALNLSVVPDTEMSAMYSNTKSTPEKVFVCTACGMKGHSSSRCWTVVGYPKWHYKHGKSGPKGGASNFGVGSSQWNSNKVKMANVAQVTSDNDDQSMTFTTAQLQHLLSMMPGSKDTEDDESPFSGMIDSKAGGAHSGKWIIDSGASDHMTATLNILENVRQAPLNFTIKLPTGAKALITHVGDLVLDNGLKMLNVLHVPDFNHNLLSIHKLAKDNGCDVTFHADKCLILDSASKRLRGMGEIYNGLYYLTQVGTIPHKAQCLQVESTKHDDQLGLWHQRLGHTPTQKLQLISGIKNQLRGADLVCLTCPMAKFTKLLFSQSNSQATERFELVHIDTWGPYKVLARKKYRFFLTIVDDFSRVTWAYLLEHKSDYLCTITAFLNYVRNHFPTSIKIIRSDNALEFNDKPCKEFYNNNGILHQTSCVYKPQQNARVERKHRQILEVARALKFQSGLPIAYWGECVLTAVYIINRIPTTALQNRIPYEVLHESPVDYEDIKVFGCLAFSANTATKGDKFQPRGIPCVFLGYPPLTKGFRLLNLITNETFVSRDVKFNEKVFPFNDKFKNAYMEPVPASVQLDNSKFIQDDDIFCEEVQNGDADHVVGDEHEDDAQTAEEPVLR